MKRLLFATIVIAHGLAHADIARWGLSYSPRWFLTALWSVALVGYVAAGCGMLRVPALRDAWKQLMIAATASSILLLTLIGAWIGVVGAIVDVALLILVFEWAQVQIDADVQRAEAVGTARLPHPSWHRAGWSLTSLCVLYLCAVATLRPIAVHWGTTPADRVLTLPGDGAGSDTRYQVEQAIVIHASADAVWPWLAQIGQGRAGFYSYDRVERLAGVRIHNENRIHPEWQAIREGDFVRATQPEYLGGRFGDLGWRVAEVVPNRALVLENWGTFAIQPIDSANSRLLIRTQRPSAPTLARLLAGPVNVLLLEPAHLIMQRAMLIGLRDRAELAARGDAGPRLAESARR